MKKKGLLTALTIAAICAAIALAGFATACSAQQAGESDAPSVDSGASSDAFVWSPEADCTMCHATQAASRTNQAYQLCASHRELDCMACHTDQSGLEEAHQDVTLQDTDGAKKLKKTSVGDDVCLSCHANDYTAEATADVTALVDSNGTTVNPHDLPATPKHEQNITCSSCHDMHSDSSVEETATSLCLSCHHKNVYECNTCHKS